MRSPKQALPHTSRTQGSQGANTAPIHIPNEASTIHLKGQYTCKACIGLSAQNFHSSLTGLFLFCIAGVVMQGGVWVQGRHPTATHTRIPFTKHCCRYLRTYIYTQSAYEHVHTTHHDLPSPCGELSLCALTDL